MMAKRRALLMILDITICMAVVGAMCSFGLSAVFGHLAWPGIVNLLWVISFWIYLLDSVLALAMALVVRKGALSVRRQRWLWVERVAAVILFISAVPFLLLAIWIYTHGGPT